MSNLWVLIANRGYAQILEVKGLGKEIRRVHFINHPEGRKKDGEINSDRPGRNFSRFGGARHAYTSHESQHNTVMKHFAHDLVVLLRDGKIEGKYDKLAIICPPDVLNEIHTHLPIEVKKCVVKEVYKDLPHYLPDESINDHIARYLGLFNYKLAA